VNAAQYLIDTSALARLLRGDAEQYGWDQAAAAGLIATCPSPSWSLSTARVLPRSTVSTEVVQVYVPGWADSSLW
jgi:hypothetical protein